MCVCVCFVGGPFPLPGSFVGDILSFTRRRLDLWALAFVNRGVLKGLGSWALLLGAIQVEPSLNTPTHSCVYIYVYIYILIYMYIYIWNMYIHICNMYILGMTQDTSLHRHPDGPCDPRECRGFVPSSRLSTRPRPLGAHSRGSNTAPNVGAYIPGSRASVRVDIGFFRGTTL